jgi:hypothetical protein
MIDKGKNEKKIRWKRCSATAVALRPWLEVTNDYSAVLSFQLFSSFLILGYAAQAPHLLESDEETDVSRNRLAEGTYVPALHVSPPRTEKGARAEKKIKQYKS